MKLIIKLCIGIMLLGILCAVPAAADIPTGIVDQYWVWYPTFNPTAAPGHWVNYVNKLGVGAPVWGPNFDTLGINNVYIPNNVKNIWIEAKYVLPQTEMANLTITDPQGVVYKPAKQWISSNGQFLTWEFHLDWQPAFETVNFGTTEFYTLANGNGIPTIELVEIGTQCVPEPSGVIALLVGLTGVGGVLFKKRA